MYMVIYHICKCNQDMHPTCIHMELYASIRFHMHPYVSICIHRESMYTNMHAYAYASICLRYSPLKQYLKHVLEAITWKQNKIATLYIWSKVKYIGANRTQHSKSAQVS